MKKMAAYLKSFYCCFMQRIFVVNECKNNDSNFVRRDSIKEFSQNNDTLSLSHILSGFDKQVSSMIKVAYDYIGELNILRANRPDVIKDIGQNNIRSVSIGGIREQIREKIIADNTDFPDPQIEAMQKLRARITKQVYDDMALQRSEVQFTGYCGEHVYLLLSSLIEQGLPSRNLRVINMEGMGGSENYEIDHSFLAYCSHGFEDNKDIESVMRVICSGNKNALFLNPWGTEKIISLNMCARREDFYEIFNRMMLEVDGTFDPSSLNIAVDIPIDISESSDSESDISDSSDSGSDTSGSDASESGFSCLEYMQNPAPRLTPHVLEGVSLELSRKRTLSDADTPVAGEPPTKKLETADAD